MFYDYDGEPIYVGQTRERLSARISRHLTNQRTDAVAMSVLDPFEVREIEIYPIVEFEEITKKDVRYDECQVALNALEAHVYRRAKGDSRYNAVLNEKDPLLTNASAPSTACYRGVIVSKEVEDIRGHPDTRIARRAQTIARLSQTISEREVSTGGLRRVLLVQAQRLQGLAERRFTMLGGAASVEAGPEDEPAGS